MARRSTSSIVGIGFQADTRQFTSGVKRVTKGLKDPRFESNRLRGTLKRLNETLSTTIARYASFGAALAAVGGFAGIARATRGVLAHGRALEQFSQQTNISISQLQGWGALLAQSGLELEDLADIIATANERLAEFGRGEATPVETLRALGLEQRALNGEFQTGEQLLLAVAEAYDRMAASGRQAQASGALTQLFGGQGRRFIPTFVQTGGDLQGGARRAGEQVGGGLTDEQGRNLSNLDKNLVRVGQTITNQFRRLIANNASQLEELLVTFQRGATEIIRSIDENMTDLIAVTNNLGKVFGFFAELIIENLQTIFNSILLIGGTNLLGKGLAQVNAQLGKADSALGRWASRIIRFTGLWPLLGFAIIDVIGRVAGLGSVANWLVDVLGTGIRKLIQFFGFQIPEPDPTTTTEGAPTPPPTERTEPGAIRPDRQLIESNSQLQRAIQDLTKQVRLSLVQSVREARQQLSAFPLSDEDRALLENRRRVLGDALRELDNIRSESLRLENELDNQTQSLVSSQQALQAQIEALVEAEERTGIPFDDADLIQFIEDVEEAQTAIANTNEQLRDLSDRAEEINRLRGIIEFGADVDVTPAEQQLIDLLEELDAETRERFRLITLSRELDLAIDSNNARKQFLQSIDEFVSDVRGGVDERLDELSQRIFSRGLSSETAAFTRRTLMELEELINAQREELRKAVEDAEEVKRLAEGAVFLGLQGSEQELIEATEALEAAVLAEEVFIDTIKERRLQWRRGIKDMEDAVREANIKEQFAEIRASIESSMETAFENIIFDGQSLKDAFRGLVNEIIKEIIRIAIIRPLVQNITGGLFSLGGSAGIPGLQSGGLANAGFAVVGEAGPEIVDFQRPARVYSNEDLAAALGSGGGTGSVTIIQNIESSDGPGVRAALAESTPQIIEAANGRIYNDLGDRNSSVSQLVRARARE